MRFAMAEGLAGSTAEEIYKSWVEWQMEGAVERFDVVQTHLRSAGVPPKVRLSFAADGLQLVSKEAGGVVEEIDYSKVVRCKKLVDGLGLEIAGGKGKSRSLKLECPESASAIYQAIQNKLHEINQMTRQRRVAQVSHHLHVSPRPLEIYRNPTQFRCLRPAANCCPLQHFHVLWDRIDEAVDRVRNGFENAKQLVKFAQKRRVRAAMPCSVRRGADKSISGRRRGTGRGGGGEGKEQERGGRLLLTLWLLWMVWPMLMRLMRWIADGLRTCGGTGGGDRLRSPHPRNVRAEDSG